MLGARGRGGVRKPNKGMMKEKETPVVLVIVPVVVTGTDSKVMTVLVEVAVISMNNPQLHYQVPSTCLCVYIVIVTIRDQ